METIQGMASMEGKDASGGSKSGVNFGVLIMCGIGLIFLIFVAVLIIALLLIMAGTYFGPLKLGGFTPVIYWLIDCKWYVFGLVILVLIYCWVCNKIDKTLIKL